MVPSTAAARPIVGPEAKQRVKKLILTEHSQHRLMEKLLMVGLHAALPNTKRSVCSQGESRYTILAAVNGTTKRGECSDAFYRLSISVTDRPESQFLASLDGCRYIADWDALAHAELMSAACADCCAPPRDTLTFLFAIV
jgi:hypothetical protein